MIGTWRRWAFTPVDPAPMAALRIACGLLTLGWTLSLLPDAQAFLSDDGLTTHAVGGTAGWWTLPVSTYGTPLVLLAAALALTLGWHSRLAAVVVVVLLIIVQRRDVYVLNSGDLLLRELAFYVALMPSGQVWSLDARHRPVELRARWGLRLLQLQVSGLYLFSVIDKLRGASWRGGTAVGQALQLHDLQRIGVPASLAQSPTFSAALTYGTLAVEASLILGLWFRRTRWPVMCAGVLMHLGIEATLLIGWFSLTVIACYLAFVPAPVLRRVVAAIDRRWQLTRGAVRASVRPSVGPSVRSGRRVQHGRIDGSDVHPAVVDDQDAQQR